MSAKVYAIYEGFPILNGSKVKDDEGNEYVFISFNQHEGTVTVTDTPGSGNYITTSAPTFNIEFRLEVED